MGHLPSEGAQIQSRAKLIRLFGVHVEMLLACCTRRQIIGVPTSERTTHRSHQSGSTNWNARITESIRGAGVLYAQGAQPCVQDIRSPYVHGLWLSSACRVCGSSARQGTHRGVILLYIYTVQRKRPLLGAWTTPFCLCGCAPRNCSRAANRHLILIIPPRLMA